MEATRTTHDLAEEAFVLLSKCYAELASIEALTLSLSGPDGLNHLLDKVRSLLVEKFTRRTPEDTTKEVNVLRLAVKGFAALRQSRLESQKKLAAVIRRQRVELARWDALHRERLQRMTAWGKERVVVTRKDVEDVLSVTKITQDLDPRSPGLVALEHRVRVIATLCNKWLEEHTAEWVEVDDTSPVLWELLTPKHETLGMVTKSNSGLYPGYVGTHATMRVGAFDTVGQAKDAVVKSARLRNYKVKEKKDGQEEG